MAGMDVFVSAFILTIVGIIVAVTLLPTLDDTLANYTGNALLASGIVSLIAGAGITLFAVRNLL